MVANRLHEVQNRRYFLLGQHVHLEVQVRAAIGQT